MDTPNIRTFSGTHEFHPTVLADTDAYEQGTDEQIIEDINSGRCPRCRGPLPTTGREFPAGSRITQCQSIPICGRCGSDELYEQLDGARGLGWGWGISPAGAWPLRAEEIEERRARYHQQMKPAILTGDGHLRC